MLGIQYRARFGQLSPKYVHLPALSLCAISPSVTAPA